MESLLEIDIDRAKCLAGTVLVPPPLYYGSAYTCLSNSYL